tara:strand:- start:2686 stop:3519 length:834 start_codon:yes stop_codon:yes gene_type:complete
LTNHLTKSKYIDVAKSIKDSNSKLLTKLPYFVVRLISKIVKEKEINEVLNKYSDDIGGDFLKSILEEFNITLEIEGLENLPNNEKCFFASNHPFGIIDGLILTSIVNNKYGHLKAIANDAFDFIPHLKPFIISVNVYGKSSKDHITALEKTYQSNIPITHFPAGAVSRITAGKVQDDVWKKSFVRKAIQHKRDIVPFYIHGKNSNLFYFVYRIRQWLGIDQNIELMLLPSEMFKKRNKTIKINIGKPIAHSSLDKTATNTEWAKKIRNQVYQLGESK